jgi:hypothetical protein
VVTPSSSGRTRPEANPQSAKSRRDDANGSGNDDDGFESGSSPAIDPQFADMTKEELKKYLKQFGITPPSKINSTPLKQLATETLRSSVRRGEPSGTPSVSPSSRTRHRRETSDPPRRLPRRPVVTPPTHWKRPVLPPKKVRMESLSSDSGLTDLVYSSDASEGEIFENIARGIPGSKTAIRKRTSCPPCILPPCIRLPTPPLQTPKQTKSTTHLPAGRVDTHVQDILGLPTASEGLSPPSAPSKIIKQTSCYPLVDITAIPTLDPTGDSRVSEMPAFESMSTLEWPPSATHQGRSN